MNQQAQTISADLRQWVVQQSSLGCRPEDLVQAMVQAGWNEDVAVAALETTLEQHLQQQAAQRGQPSATPVPSIDLGAAPAWLDAGDRRVQVLAVLAHPRVVLLGGLLDEAECDALIAAARPRLARSLTVVTETGGEAINEDRTSRGMFFSRGENPVVRRVEARIARLLNWPVENGEGMQVLHYGPGAEYKPHYDYFDPNEPGTATLCARGGQRVGTVVMYLNEPEQGGGTSFPDVGLVVAPQKGHAVFFSYDQPDPVTRTLHGGEPVLAGEKWIATKWLRQREFL